MRVDEAADGLVEGVAGETVVRVELRRDSRCEAGDECVDLLLCRLVAGDGVGARKRGEVLAEAVAGDVAGQVLRRIEVG